MSFELTIEPLGETIEVEEGQSILDAALRAGIYLPHACCHGLCATCKVDVLEGEVEHNEASPFALMDFEREEGKTLACCCTLESDAVIEADIDEDPDARSIPVEDFNGTVTKIVDLTPTIKGVFIRPDRKLDFQAGQYINLDVPGQDTPRAFSLANAPQEDEIELNIRKVEGGVGTTWVHETLAEGDSVSLSSPWGRFFVRKSANAPMVFMAGGSGLSSPKSMILDLLAEGCTQPITLVHGARNKAELYYDEFFTELEAKHDNFRYIPALSEPLDGDDWSGETGYVHDVAGRAFDNDFRDHKAYLCGPPPMIEACIRTLMQGRLYEKDIYMEKFLSAADGDQATRSPLFKNL